MLMLVLVFNTWIHMDTECVGIGVGVLTLQCTGLILRETTRYNSVL